MILIMCVYQIYTFESHRLNMQGISGEYWYRLRVYLLLLVRLVFGEERVDLVQWMLRAVYWFIQWYVLELLPFTIISHSFFF